MVIWLEDLHDRDDDAEESADAEETEKVTESVGTEAAIADDDGWSLLDIEAARFTRH